MNKRKLLSIVLCMVLVLTAMIPMVSAMAESPKQESLRVVHISDDHILPKELIKNTKDYDIDLNSDRKMFTESDAIVDEQLRQVRKEKPDVLLLSGDLTKDGELQAHQALARKLRSIQKDLPEMKIYVINGNHDINNKNGKNFNTADGKAVPAARTSPAAFVKNYDMTYKDPSVIARFKPAAGKSAGQLSYVARPKKGFTFIVIDSGRYSADNTASGRDEHETSGQIGPDLESWVLKQIAAAKSRGDVVLGMEHHNLVPHFTYEPVLLPMYLVNDYDRIGTEFADAGMHFIFTGHMHAQDVSKLRTAKGNDLYDFENGSSITYPSPFRVQTFTRTKDGVKVNGRTVENLKVNFTNPVTGQNQTINDLSAYGKSQGITTKMLQTTVNGYLKTLFEGKGLKYPEDLENAVAKVIKDLTELPVSADGHNLIQFANYTYQSHLDGTDDGNDPAWFKEARAKVADGSLIDQAVLTLSNDLVSALSESRNLLVKGLFGGVSNKLVSQLGKAFGPVILGHAKTLAPDVSKTIDTFLVDLIDSMSHDTNYPNDLSFNIYEKYRVSDTTGAKGNDKTRKAAEQSGSTISGGDIMNDGGRVNPAGAEMTALNKLVAAGMTAANKGL